MEKKQSERNSAKQDYYIINMCHKQPSHLPVALQSTLCTKADTLLSDFTFCRSILSSATCSKIIFHKNPKWKRKKDKELFHTLLAMCCKFLKFLRILVLKIDLAANISQVIPQALEESAMEL